MASLGHLEVCFVVLVLFCVTGLTPIQAQELENVENEKVCQGTSHGLVARGDFRFRYSQYKDLYTNCTYLFGNLEIIFLDQPDQNFDLSFLSNIRQVTGYVLIVGVHANYVPLTNLQIIRGKTLFHRDKSKDDYSLFVALNYDKNNQKIGLKELGFTSLQEILRGKIFFMNNNLLCFENTINWSDINPYVKPPVEFRFNSTDYRRPCEPKEQCHPSCYSEITKQRHCWGAGEGMCQKLTHGDACHTSCDRRCFGKLPNQCCHRECAGGCSGPLKTDCFTCRNFFDEGACVPYCAPVTIYDNRRMMNVKNPDAKYAYGGICVKECPGYLLQDAGSCVRACPEGKHPRDGKNCVKCDGPCPRKCNGTGSSLGHLTAKNIGSFVGCTTIDGNLRIIMASLRGDKHYGIEALHPNDLMVLKHVRDITGFLLIQSDHVDFKNLSFLSSLETINGRQLDGGVALHILATPLESLELTSFKRVAHGNVYILANNKLCYANTINWKKLFDTDSQLSKVEFNKDQKKCRQSGDVCDPECNGDGCWGKGPNKCLTCRNFEFIEAHLCLNNCSSKPRLYHAGENECKRCHPECSNSCTGPNNTQCDSCIHATVFAPDGEMRCVPECPTFMYMDSDNVCQECHKYCKEFGCTGPNVEVGENGCNSCEKGLKRLEGDDVIICLPPDTESCDPGYHMVSEPTSISSPMAGRKVCSPCHKFCETCSGPGVTYCVECKRFRGMDNFCTDKCSTYTFGDLENRMCVACHQECRGGCSGATIEDCTACSNFKIFLDEELTRFNCTAECPSHLPYQVRDPTMDDDNRNVCADETHEEVQSRLARDKEEEKKKIIVIVVPIVLAVLALGILLATTGYYCQKRAKSKEKTAELTAKMTGFDQTEPVTPTNAQPDLAKLRLIKESELRKGGIIGSGAFGTVYKGFWIPQGENVKIPVAIKVLQDGTSPNQNQELLEEARVMASVEHACCIRILAVCMSAQMMLITQLMPLGCLLDYVRKNKEHIGSKVLLNWCTQIAKGMSYLEERGIVHRDLAARNVLVQTPTQVKITDFGLAKLLDYNEDEYHAAGGKMPIKWLALECIQHRIFTHKSDVWSFGVTAWELFTYGQKPYDNIRARDVPGLLEKGERLPQPTICTIDVYMIMIKCWMLDAESRPSFKELAEEFAKMARDPGRYLVVQGDVLKRIPDENFRGSDLDLIPIDGVDFPSGTMGEGDKLMRLPSHSYDKNELVRSVSVAADGPEEIVEADDYLQPQEALHSPRQVNFENNNSPSISTPLLPQGACPFPMKPEKGEVSGLPWREKNYAHLDRAVEAKKQRQQLSPARNREDSFNSRYSSDPVRFFKDKEELEGLEHYKGAFQYPSPNDMYHNHGGMAPASKHPPNAKPMHIPVDEDNYLAPHSTSNPAMYTDLSDKGYYQNEKVFEEDPIERETDAMLANNTSASSGAPLLLHHNPHHPNPSHPLYHASAPYAHPLGKRGGGGGGGGGVAAVAVANPEYFDQDDAVVVEPMLADDDDDDNNDDEDDTVWETKPSGPFPNGGVHNSNGPLPGGGGGGVGPPLAHPLILEDPAFLNSKARTLENGHHYYNDFSPTPIGGVRGGVDSSKPGRVLVRDQLPSESQV